MNRMTRVSVLIGSALGGAVMAQTTIAGPGCNHAGNTAGDYSDGYSPAIYVPAPGSDAAARAYPAGLTYMSAYSGHSADAAQADIVDTAIAAGSFDTLVAAVSAAGLGDTLKGKGPFTVFAPTDAAFAKLPKAQLDALLKDKAALTKVLTYHVVAGEVKAAEVMSLSSAVTVEGQSLTIKAGDSVMINDARVIQADIMTSNGVIHVIDTVMLPPDLVSQL